MTPVASTVERVEQYVTFVNQAEKPALLTMMLRVGFGAKGSMDRVLIFSRTKHGADRIVKQLAQTGIPANAIHGNKSQPQRERALAEFKDGKVKILIATDIAARGIDVSGVSHVINFDLPNVSEQYVHRIGRTARAGAAGVAVAYCAEDERPYLKGIERLTKQVLTPGAAARRLQRRGGPDQGGPGQLADPDRRAARARGAPLAAAVRPSASAPGRPGPQGEAAAAGAAATLRGNLDAEAVSRRRPGASPSACAAGPRPSPGSTVQSPFRFPTSFALSRE